MILYYCSTRYTTDTDLCGHARAGYSSNHGLSVPICCHFFLFVSGQQGLYSDWLVAGYPYGWLPSEDWLTLCVSIRVCMYCTSMYVGMYVCMYV